MPSVKSVEDGTIKRRLVSMTVGGPGTGKSHNSATYPKCFFLITEPEGQDTWLNKAELRKNVVWYEECQPSEGDEDKKLKFLYNPIIKDCGLVKLIQQAKDMQAKGEIETLVIDNLTYLVHNKWMHIEKYEKQLTKQGEVNTMAMYGMLRNWCYDLFVNYIINFKGNVVVTAHEMLESEDTLERQIDKSITIVPNIMGGFRYDVLGLFSNVFYLVKEWKKEGGLDKYKYIAITNKGYNRNAKNRFNLPTVIENPSYEVFVKAIAESNGGK